MPLTRRRFIQTFGTAAAAVLAGCTREAPPVATVASTTTTNPTPTVPDLFSDLPFSVWADVQDAIRSSPDHLVARAAQAVASGDPQQVFAFVRDSISTVPPRVDGFREAGRSVRYRSRTLLRTGRGTPREKAELLTELLRQAGYDCRVVLGFPTVPVDSRLAVLRESPTSFAPEISEERVAAWFEALRMPPPGRLPHLDPDGSIGNEIASTVERALGSGREAPSFDWSMPEIPLVDVDVAGSRILANAAFPGAVWSEQFDGVTVEASEVVFTSRLGVALQVAYAADPSVRHTVVEGSWPVEQLAGRRVLARFVPEGDVEAVLRTPPARLLAHTAVLVVDGSDVDLDADPALAVFGDTVTVGGPILHPSEGGLLVGGAPFGADPEAPSAVARVEASVEARAFPHVSVTISATDAAGRPVDGVPAASVSIMEEGSVVPFLLTQTRPPEPSVLLVFDTSGSIPATFREDGAVAFGLGLAEAVHAAHPGAAFRVAGVASGSLAASPNLVTEPAALEVELRRVVGFGSDVWSAVAQARFVSPTLVVLVSDGKLTDAPDAITEARSWISAGPPVVSIAVGDVEPSALEEIAGLSGGAVFPVSDPEEAALAVAGFLDAEDLRPLRAVYRAGEAGPAQRTVMVTIGSHSASGEYTVPAAPDRLDPPALAGIYLRVTLDGQQVIRTVAGVAHETAVRSTPVDHDTRNAVHAALFGTVEVSLEGGAPTYSAWLEDALVARQSWRAMLEAASRGESAVQAAVESRMRLAPPRLPILHTPLESGEDAGTFEAGPRVVVLTSLPLWDGGAAERADLLPFTRFFTVGPAPADAYRLNLRRTARLAAAEMMFYDDHTKGRLEGRELTVLPKFGSAPRETLGAFQAAVLDRYGSWDRLLPVDGGTFAFWAVDESGSLLGILPDGSGGGAKKSTANEKCKAVNQAAGVADTAAAAAGMPMAWGAFIALQKAIAKQAIREAAIIESLGSPMPDTSACGSPGDFPCDVAKGAVYDAIPAGKAIALIDAGTAAATGEDAVSC